MINQPQQAEEIIARGQADLWLWPGVCCTDPAGPGTRRQNCGWTEYPPQYRALPTLPLAPGLPFIAGGGMKSGGRPSGT